MTNITFSSNNCQVSLDVDCELSITELSQLVLIVKELIDNCTSQDLENIAESVNDSVMAMIDSASYKPFTIPDAILRLIK